MKNDHIFKAKNILNISFSFLIITLLLLIFLSVLLYLYTKLDIDSRLMLLGFIATILLFGGVSRYVFKRRSYITPIQSRDFSQEADENLINLFTNQKEALLSFANLISGNTGYKLLSIYGVSGSGKSWLLRYYRYEARARGMIVSLVDASSVKSAVEILITIFEDLEREGAELPYFERKLDQYKHIQAKVARESQSWQVATKVALELGKQIPVIGQASQVLDFATQEEFLLLLGNLLTKEDIDLYINPERALTSQLLEDIKQMTLQHRIVLLFDAYESIKPFDIWLKSFVSRLARDVYVVIAGQTPISDNWRDIREIAKIMEIIVLDDENAEQCLDNYTQEYLNLKLAQSEKSKIIKFSGGLPLAIGWTVDLMSRYKIRDFSEVRNEVVANLVDTMTKSAPPDVKQVIEVCAVPRWFTEDTLKQLLADTEINVTFSMLRLLPFVRSRPEGLAIHDRVREFLLEDLKRRSMRSYIDLNNKCVDMFSRFTMHKDHFQNLNSPNYRKSIVELVYHTLNVDEDGGFDLVSRTINKAFMTSKLDFCEILLSEILQRDLSELHENWAQYWKGELAYRKGRWFKALETFSAIQNKPVKDMSLSISVHITMGRIYYQHGEVSRARTMYQYSLSLMKESGQTDLIGYVTEQLAKVYRMEGDLEGAVEIHKKSLLLASKSNNTYAICSVPGSYGTTLILSGELRRGVEQLSKSVQLGRNFDYAQFVCTGLRSRAVGLMLLGQLKDAEQSASDSLQIAERLGDVYNQGFARLALGQIYTARCVYASLAESILERAIKDLESVGAKFDLGNAWVALGNFYFTQDEYDFAQRSFKRAHELLSTLDFKYGLGWLYFYQGILADRLQSPKRAEDFFEKSEEIARSIGSRYLQSQVLLRRALITLYDTKEIRGQYFLGESLVLAEEMRYHDVIAKVNLHKGISMLGNSYNSDDVFIYFWEAVRSAICYNCFLLDEVASTIRKRDCPQFIREAIIHKWKETDLLSVELDNRDKEVGQRYSNLDKILG